MGDNPRITSTETASQPCRSIRRCARCPARLRHRTFHEVLLDQNKGTRWSSRKIIGVPGAGADDKISSNSAGSSATRRQTVRRTCSRDCRSSFGLAGRYPIAKRPEDMARATSTSRETRRGLLLESGLPHLLEYRKQADDLDLREEAATFRTARKHRMTSSGPSARS